MSLATRSLALQHLRAVDLDEEIHSSLTELSILSRKASAEIRIRLLPILDEVKRRYDQGETINKKKGYHEYIRSLGLTPSTVRSWKTRDHQRIFGHVLKKLKQDEKNYVELEERKYERKLKEEIAWDVASAERDKEEEREEKEHERRLKEDPEFRRQEEEKEAVKVAAPGRVQQARGNKEGDFKSAYGGKPPKRHKPTDGGKPGTGTK
jgi:hypothetical protein